MTIKLERFKWHTLHGTPIGFYISGKDRAYIDDYLVKEMGLYPNRSEFIRVAIRNQIQAEIKRIIFERDK